MIQLWRLHEKHREEEEESEEDDLNEEAAKDEVEAIVRDIFYLFALAC